jgi:glutathione S-transferase
MLNDGKRQYGHSSLSIHHSRFVARRVIRGPEVRMTTPVSIIGSYLSPYVRKALVCLDLKGIAYEIDPIIPFMGDERFSRLSPIRRIPVLIDDRVTLTDSSVICQYLEDRYPQPALYPTDIVARAQARWLEEFADTRMGEVFIWGLFNQVAINPYVWGRPTDTEVLNRILNEDIPHVLDYLEAHVPAAGFCFGDVSIADISIACVLRNAAFARFSVDEAHWPRTAGFVDRVLGLPSFQKLKPFENKMLRTPIPQQRAALAEMGAPVMRETYGSDHPKPGLMRI